MYSEPYLKSRCRKGLEDRNIQVEHPVGVRFSVHSLRIERCFAESFIVFEFALTYVTRGQSSAHSTFLLRLEELAGNDGIGDVMVVNVEILCEAANESELGIALSHTFQYTSR